MKKVLASVLAGSMILGMAAMASAAQNLGLEAAKSGEYDYQLYLYEPYGTIDVDKTGEYKMSSQTQKAFENFKAEYKRFTADRTEAGLTAYFDGHDNVFNAYDDFWTLASTDFTNSSTNSVAKELGIDTKDPGTMQADGSNTFNHFKNRNSPVSAANTPKVLSCFATQGITPSAIQDAITALKTSGTKATGRGEYVLENKARVDIADGDYMSARGLDKHFMYTYGEDNVKEVKFQVIVKHGDDFRVDVASGKVTVTRKRVDSDTTNDTDTYVVSIKAAAGVRDFELSDFKVELDCSDANRVYYIEGEVAYSDYREVLPDDRYIIKKSNKDNLHNDGCVFNFDEVIDDETRIICSDYVDVLFKGNYGTDFENMLVKSDDIQEVEDFFQDYDIDYYDFIGTPKFAKDITVRIDADSDAYIYEYDKKTGDVVDITDECEYTSDGMTFKRKNLKTYVVLEEPYEGGNVKAEKEPIVEEEPEDEPKETEEPKDDPSSEGSKPNPGTGAYPLF